LFQRLGRRERLIAKLAVLAGMRPGEIFGLTWGQVSATYAEIRQRVYAGCRYAKNQSVVPQGGARREVAQGHLNCGAAMAVDTRGRRGSSHRSADAAVEGQLLAPVMLPAVGKVWLDWAIFL
jgi:hypothetical protein